MHHTPLRAKTFRTPGPGVRNPPTIVNLTHRSRARSGSSWVRTRGQPPQRSERPKHKRLCAPTPSDPRRGSSTRPETTPARFNPRALGSIPRRPTRLACCDGRYGRVDQKQWCHRGCNSSPWNDSAPPTGKRPRACDSPRGWATRFVTSQFFDHRLRVRSLEIVAEAAASVFASAA